MIKNKHTIISKFKEFNILMCCKTRKSFLLFKTEEEKNCQFCHQKIEKTNQTELTNFKK